MKPIRSAGFALLLFVLPPISAWAASPAPATTGGKAPATADSLRNAARPLPHARCLRHTGTRLRLPPGQCAPVFGRVYDRAALEASGSATLSGALTTLDPALGP